MKQTNHIVKDFYESCKYEDLHITDIPNILLKDKENICQFNLCKGYGSVIIGTTELIDYIIDNLDYLREFQGKIFFKLNDYGSIVFDSIEIMWNRRLD